MLIKYNATMQCQPFFRYLHEVCLPPVVHRNLKSANILLDKEYSPHLSDCGLAALTPNPEREVSNVVPHLYQCSYFQHFIFRSYSSSLG